MVLCGPFADVGLWHGHDGFCSPIWKVQLALEPQSGAPRYPVGAVTCVRYEICFKDVLSCSGDGLCAVCQIIEKGLLMFAGDVYDGIFCSVHDEGRAPELV